MKDFNFFEPYLDKKEISNYNILILYAVISITILGLITYPLINVFRITFLKKNIATMKTSLESSDLYKQLNIVEQRKEEITKMEEQLSLIKDIDKVIESRNVINDLLLNKITNKVPKDVFFESLNLSSNQIQIQGSATNNLAIAQFENNLKSDKYFKDIYIPSISLNEGLYNFSISFALKTTEKDNIKQNNAEQKDVEQNEIE